MFGFLFRRKEETPRRPALPPTDKQIRYAKMLGITVGVDMTRDELSKRIAQAENDKPEYRKKREAVLEKRAASIGTPESRAAEDYWNDLYDKNQFILAIYRKGKSNIVDVLHVWGARHNEREKLVIEFAAPKYYKRDDYMLWDKEFELPVEKLLYHELLKGDFDLMSQRAYMKEVEKGLKIAKKMKL